MKELIYSNLLLQRAGWYGDKLACVDGDYRAFRNLIPDAITASILEANGIQKVYTHDRDFWKFPGLKPVDPF